MTQSIDIVIAHRGPELGLWATIASCEMALSGSKIDYKYYIVGNGLDKDGPEAEAYNLTIKNMRDAGHVGAVLDFPEPISPPSARNAGVKAGFAPYIFFLDNHCLVEPTYFKYGVEALDNYKCDCVHSSTKYWPGDTEFHHYGLTLERDFLGIQESACPTATWPYRIAVAGHGGFAIKRAVWEFVGGYWDGFVGYGGEETYFDLKLGMFDFNNYLEPRMKHWHNEGTRTYDRFNSDECRENLLCSAYIIGGYKWLRKVACNLDASQNKPWSEWVKADIDRLANNAIDRATSHRLWFTANAERDLDEQLTKWRKEGVAL